MQRNLLMHVYPRMCHGGRHQHWRRSVAHVKARFSQFTGRRVVSVAFDVDTATPDEVREAFGECEVEIFGVRNSQLQEMESFPRLLEAVSREPGITFYCHSKGCTHCPEGSASHSWCDAMAEVCLDYPQLIDCAMEVADVCGAFRSRQHFGWEGPSPPFHFAGTFYWFRNDALFSRDWRSGIHQFLWGAETYPGWIFPEDRSRCLFFDNAQMCHLYNPDSWRSTIYPGLANWRKALAGAGLRPLIPRGIQSIDAGAGGFR